MNNLYKGLFNWQGEIHKLHTHAKSRDKAFRNFTVQLSEIVRFTDRKVSNYFKTDKKPKFKIILLKRDVDYRKVNKEMSLKLLKSMT